MKRSAGVTAFAVLFIMGNVVILLTLLVGVMGSIFSAMPPTEDQQNLTRAIKAMASPLGMLSIVAVVAGFVSAFALLRLRAWARWTTIVLAGYYVILPFVIMMTPNLEVQDTVKALSPYFRPFELAWYGLVIWYFLRPSVKAQFQAARSQ